jgi:hypothetical protein
MTPIRIWLSLATGMLGFFFSVTLSNHKLWFLQSILFAVIVAFLTYVTVRRRVILYGLFGAYQCAALFFTYLVDGHLDLLGLLKYIPWFKYIAFLGLLMIVVDVLTWYFIELKANKKENAELKEENINLKARIYDLQESAKKSEGQNKP